MILSPDWPRLIGPRIVQGLERWVVDARPKCRRFFASEADAKNYRNHLRREVATHGLNGQGPDEQMDAAKAREILAAYRVSLTTAAAFYHEEHENKRKALLAPTMTQICDDHEKIKAAEERRGEFSNQSLKTLRSSLKKIREHWPDSRPVSITESQVLEWLDGMSSLSQQTRFAHRKVLSRLMKVCKRKGWVTENPCEGITVRVVRDLEAEILTVEESRALLDAATASPFASTVVPFVLIGLFAGLRPWEVQAIAWEDIQGDQIRVNWETSKRRETRYVPMEPGLSAKLEKYRGKGKIVGANWETIWLGVRGVAGWGPSKPWTRDILRHSYASFWLAMHGNRAELSERMGNSPAIIRRHYRRAVQKSESEAFWGLLQKTA